jgi:hypothetical protein
MRDAIPPSVFMVSVVHFAVRSNRLHIRTNRLTSFKPCCLPVSLQFASRSAEHSMDETESWDCPRCSFKNHPDLPQCEICEFNRKELFSSSYSSQCQQHVAQKPEPVTALATPRQVPVVQTAGAVDGLAEMIKQQGLRNLRVKYCLSHPPSAFYSQKGSYGAAWSCGYRNIQMLCSSLVRIEEYRLVLFEGDGTIPDVPGVQRWIERAWAAGFDVEVTSSVIPRTIPIPPGL